MRKGQGHFEKKKKKERREERGGGGRYGIQCIGYIIWEERDNREMPSPLTKG